MRRVVAGAGHPAVVLEAGMNCGSEAWARCPAGSARTGHDIPGNRPDLVADAILAVAAQVLAGAS